MSRVVILGKYHEATSQFATGINLDTLRGDMFLSNHDYEALIGKEAFHLPVDRHETVIDEAGDMAICKSTVFTYNGKSARAIVEGQKTNSGGFYIQDESNGDVLLSSPSAGGVTVFDAGSGQVSIVV